jgi:hypothetical protein
VRHEDEASNEGIIGGALQRSRRETFLSEGEEKHVCNPVLQFYAKSIGVPTLTLFCFAFFS